MRKIVLVIMTAAVVGYFINSYIVIKSEQEAKKAEAERVHNATKAAVSQMATQKNAISDWEETLSNGESFRFEPILTIELERLWLQQRPILFIGSIKDIATYDNSQYLVSVERSFYGSLEYMFGTELQLSLLSEKEYIDSFLKNYPELFKDYGFKNAVAVVARINNIKTKTVLEADGERVEVKVGVGELVEILYMGDVIF